MGNEVIIGLVKKKCENCAGIDRCGMMKIGCWDYPKHEENVHDRNKY